MRRFLLAAAVFVLLVVGVAWGAPSRRMTAGEVERAVVADHGPAPPIACRSTGLLRRDWWCSSRRWSDPLCLHVTVTVGGSITVPREPAFCSYGNPDAA